MAFTPWSYVWLSGLAEKKEKIRPFSKIFQIYFTSYILNKDTI